MVPACLLRDHGDRQVPVGTDDLAVNVWGPPPAWVLAAAAGADLSRYPDARAAEAAAAARHGRPAAEALAVNGAAEAFWALAHGLRPRLAACVHPSFTAPEAALRSAGVAVHRVVRDPGTGFALDPATVPEAADLVVLGRPDNPTGRVEPVATVAALTRPGRLVVVDEAFLEFHTDAGGFASRPDLPGVVAVRSLTKLWAVPGLRVGYVVGPAGVLARMREALQPWPVNAPAARLLEVLCPAGPARAARAAGVARARRSLTAGLATVPGLRVWPATANFVLVRHPEVDLRRGLLARGLAVRRADTFPGLDASYARVAVHPQARVRERLVAELRGLTDPTEPVRTG
ncbi:MAG: aminotransferase class I/II-fold pyridoxal phosphate-dependent enzyme [Kineosporiaceae bacterium]